MKEGLELSQNLTHNQTLAPLQVQFVKLLEMNTAAIEEEVRRRVDENPALEIVYPGGNAGNIVADSTFSESAEQLQRADFRNDDDIPDYLMSGRFRTANDSADVDRRTVIESSTAEYYDMSQLLLRQLREIPDISARDRAFAEYIIGDLDSNGRLTRSLSEMADDISFSTGAEILSEDLEPALRIIRSLDPPGVGAIDLQDCLLLQLNRYPDSATSQLAKEIVRNHFNLLGLRRMDKLETATGVSCEELEKAIALIRTLNPKPGNSEGANPEDNAMHISPDFIVEPDGVRKGFFNIYLTQQLPELRVAQWQVDTNTVDSTDVERFIRSRTSEANEFLGLLQRRSRTLNKIMAAIVKHQSKFFSTEDESDIRPMVLRDIAADTGKDISVVSRAISGKYVATQGGVYPLKMFFGERPTASEDISAHAIMRQLRELVDNEDKKKPLSDDALTAALQARGMDIARRTVAKYREQMKIPNSRGRRAMKKF